MFKYKVSVVVISLNTRNDFLKTIKSIFSQSFTKYEVIIIDGGSTDGTVEEIFKIKNKNVKYIVKKDRGIYYAMNKGIKLCRGEWVYFLNSGDIFYNKNILKKIFVHKLNNSDIIYGNTIINAHNLFYLSVGNEFNKNTVLMPFCHQSCMIKSEILKKNLFNIKYKLSSDFNLLFKLYLSKKIFLKINEIFSLVDGTGVSNSNRQRVLSENIKTLKELSFIKNVYKLYILKLNEFFKSLIKFFLPNFIIKIFIQLKYYKSIIK